jgi:hypothetical protein
VFPANLGWSARRRVMKILSDAGTIFKIIATCLLIGFVIGLVVSYSIMN